MSGKPGIAGIRVNRTPRSHHPATRATSLLGAGVVVALAILSGCGPGEPSAPGPISLELWAHKGDPEEVPVLPALVKSFEAAHKNISVKATVVDAQDDYNDKVQGAIASGDLPDVFDVDGPYVAAYAYQGALAPLDDVLGFKVQDRMISSLVAQGTWRGHLWAIGAFDSGLAMYGDRRQLERAGVRIPTGPDDAWTAAEMKSALVALAAHDADGKVIDLRVNEELATEWLTYGFGPLLYSAGAALIDPETGRAGGTLDSPAAVSALTDLRDWAAYADPAPDSTSFTSRKVALSWAGHSSYGEYSPSLGADLVLIPLPNLGNGTKSGQGSWAWVLGAGSSHEAAAATLLDWLTNDNAAKAITDANGAVPGTKDALARSALVGPGKPLHLFGDQLARACVGAVTKECITVPRPVTPAYPTVTAAFSGAVFAILKGEDPKAALSKAARTIDANLEANHGFDQAPASP